MKDIWVASDLHFLHDNLCRPDYCNRPKNHTERIFNELMRIPEDDMLICLGDISMGREQDVHDWFIKPLKCRKILVKGNHDRRSNTWYLNHGWDFVCYSFIDTYHKKRILFTHHPKDAKDVDYNIHGHMHNNCYKFEHLTKENANFVNEKHLLISMELTNYKPVKLNYILDKPEKFSLFETFRRNI